MREPKLHGPYPPKTPGGSQKYFVQWYDDDQSPRHSKQFTDEVRAQLFLQEKVQRRPIDTQMIILQKASFIEKAVAAFLEKDDEALLSVEAENTRLRDKLAALEKQLRTEQTRRNEKAPGAKPTGGQSINFRALQWAVAQRNLPAPARHILLIFAIHADERGYTWPGVDRIASISGQDPGTVRKGIEEILGKRRIFRTKKRRGATGQVKVYRLPRITYERGGKSNPFENDESEGKARDKRGISLGNSAPNNGIMKKEQEHHHQASDELMTLGTSVPLISSNEGSTSDPSESSIFVEGHHHQNHLAREHIKWPEFATWCGSQKGKPAKESRVHDGIPTEKGFRKWMRGQKPEWRNKQSQIDGYELDGEFLTPEEANRIAAENPRLLVEDRFRRARKMQLSDGNWWLEDESGAAISSSFLSPKR
jgi:hypothetical protein